MFGLVSRRRREQELAAAQNEIAALRRRVLATEERHDEVVREHNRLAEELAATRIVNGCLTGDLTDAQARLAEYDGRRTVSDVLIEHDIHRTALADALGEQMRHLNWDQLIADAKRTREAAEEWMKDHTAEKKRADRLQQRLDDTLGLDDPAVLAGQNWQATRQDIDRKGTSS
ncbi:hypothetical protein ACFYQA_08505 [Streptomyces sp. NPDC005774]|uniref:hypothetical protein n=1 Tax=Streptomyces sp. NPDC005774 TaxID=3364728 RepID=UPI0036C27D1D